MPTGERQVLRDALAATARRQAAYEAREAKVEHVVYRGLSRDGRALGWTVCRDGQGLGFISKLSGNICAADWAGVERSSRSAASSPKRKCVTR